MPQIWMKALQYQSVPTGNDRSYVDKDAEFFVNSEEEAAAREARGLAERTKKASSKKDTTESTEGETDKAKEGEEENLATKPWAMQVDESAYLEKWPEGPHAEHAKARLAAARKTTK